MAAFLYTTNISFTGNLSEEIPQYEVTGHAQKSCDQHTFASNGTCLAFPVVPSSYAV